MSGPAMSSAQMHKMMRVAWPEFYRIAARNGQIWVSVWCDGNRIREMAPQPICVQLRETTEHLEVIPGNSLTWTKIRLRGLRGRITFGLAETPVEEPFFFADDGGYFPGRVRRKDTLTLDYAGSAVATVGSESGQGSWSANVRR